MSDVDKLSGTDVTTPQLPLPVKFILEQGPKSPAKIDAILRLKALVEEYAGDETITIHPSSVSTAESFLRALPDGISLPEFSVEPDGFISMDWIAARDRVFSMSIGADGRFACAWIDGTSEGHCVENFNGQTIPKRIIDGITAIMGSEYAAFRAA